jgi:guanosine-3',5'-bis(diphosphate) 3'-pyrophosphohydrolase
VEPSEIDAVAAEISGLAQIDPALFKTALVLADRAHAGQTRRSGEPYVTHPIAVARLVAEWGMDDASVCAAVLHDVVEDTLVSVEDLEAEFNGFDTEVVSDIVFLVGGLTKLDGLKLVADADPDEKQAASLQKLLVAIAADARVLVVKVADRLHNVRTLGYLRPDKARRIARETMDVYAPLAARLGMAHASGELDDLCFAVLFPERYAELERLVAERAGERSEWISDVTAELQSALAEHRVAGEVSGRAKRLWSVYEKMVHKGRTFDQVLDLVGIRIIVEDIAACYSALGVVHGLFSPVPGRFKDWIATPRYNLYQSLHTTVVTATGAPLEVQIRTAEMHQRAEWGVAAHWRYKSEGHTTKPQWMQRLEQVSSTATDAASFLEQITKELASDEVLCFTPKGEVIALPEGSTPVDFAYAVHTDVGHACSGSRVNNKLVSLTTRLRTGDRVEIVTDREGGPNREWLTTVASSRARSRIKQWFAREVKRESSEAGKTAVSKELALRGVPGRIVRFDALDVVAASMNFSDADELLAAVGQGRVAAADVAERMVPAGVTAVQEPAVPLRELFDNNVPVVVDGADGIPVRLARCCSPVRGDSIVGYVAARSGDRVVSIHRTDCPDSARLAAERRPVDVQWRSGRERAATAVLVMSLDRPGLLSDVARAITNGGGEIQSSSSSVGQDMVSRQRFDVAVCDLDTLSGLLDKVRAVSGVFYAERA